MIRRKKGSTLVVTIIVCAVVFTVGMAFLSMTISGYKLTQSQNKRIENLYGADSGLDVAYDIMVKEFDSAAQFGSFRAKQLAVKDANNGSPYKQDYNDLKIQLQQVIEWNSTHDKEHRYSPNDIKNITNQMDELTNREFRRSFKCFLYVSIANTSTKEYRPNQLIDSLTLVHDGDKKTTRRYITGLIDNLELKNDITDNGKEFFKSYSVELVSNGVDSEPQISVDIPIYPKIENNYDDYKNNEELCNQDYQIKVSSTFSTVNNNTNVNGEHKRTVQAIYNLKVPNYKDVSYSEREVNNSAYKGKGLTIGGNMDVTGGDVTVDGNIFVEGKLDGTDLQSKYKNGISLNNVGKVDFLGNVVTGETFNVGSGVNNATISKNLYAGNVYVGDKDNLDSYSENSKLNIAEDMIVNNDLTLKAIHSSITTNNFYGINSNRSESSTDPKLDKVKNSSSIIVNKYKDVDTDQNPSKIKIHNEALIMGVAYINTGNEQGGYATGESVGVKGNYNAYSQHVDSDDSKNLEFDKDEDKDAQSPLYLINGYVFDKNIHFYDYWNGKNVDSGGVHFDQPDKIKSLGSVVCDGSSLGSQVKLGNGSIERLNNESEKKQKEYASRVYDMDMDTTREQIIADPGARLKDLYDNSYKGKTVDNLMSFPNTDDNDKFKTGNAIQIGDINDDFGVFNPSPNRKIEIKEITSSAKFDITGLSGDRIVISVPSGKQLNAFIATAGDVTISGKVTIYGNIIAKGNLIMKESGDKNITYDGDLAAKLQVIDSDIFRQVFGTSDTNSNTQGKNTDVSVEYDLPKFLKNVLWKLVK